MITKLSDLPDTGTLTVACKLPRGLRLELPADIAMMKEQKAAYAEARKAGRSRDFEPVRLAEAPFVTLKGWSVAFGASTMHISGGYGLTTGVDAAKFKLWYTLAVEAKFPPVMEDQIFACAKEAVARDQAAEQEEVPAIAAPLDPANPGKGLEPDTRS